MDTIGIYCFVSIILFIGGAVMGNHHANKYPEWYMLDTFWKKFQAVLYAAMFIIGGMMILWPVIKLSYM